jgi:hypothetical protein
MSMTRLVRSFFVALALACTAAAPGCKSAEVTAENIAEQGVLMEQHEGATVVWAVKPDGQVRALVKGADDKPVEEGVTGTLSVKPSKDAAPVTAELKLEEKTGGVLATTIPKLEADLTEVTYNLKVGGKPVKGVLHLPKGGTQELYDSAKVTAEATLEGKKGPNGGIVQVVGEETFEIVADKKSGRVRVYLLDDDLKAVAIKDPKLKVKLALTGSSSETVELKPDAKGLYFEGKLTVKTNPTKITVVVHVGDVVHVALCGWHPGVVIVVGPRAPGIVIFVSVKWDVDVVVVHDHHDPVIVIDHHHHHHKHKGKHKGKHGHHRYYRH